MARMNKYDRTHLARLNAYQKQVDAIYAEAIKEATRLAAQLGEISPSAAFSFADYPNTRKRIETLLEGLKSGLSGVLVNGIQSEWTLANNKNNELSRQVFGDNVGRLTQEQYRRYFSTNGVARDAFIARRDAGMNLSDRVWNYTSQFKAEMEMVCELGIRNGMSAEEMQRDLQQYLKHPDNFFRRFRYKEGTDDNGKPIYGRKWKKREWDDINQRYTWRDVDLADYSYGRGVYRSSYKNARRLAVTETNIAYRTADHLRWQQMDFVVGIRIECSKTNHPVPDICDELAGDYPKDFKWTGWHPHCRCHATPILKTEEELMEDNRRILQGDEPVESSVNAVDETPTAFNAFVKDNADKITAARTRGKEPYFLADNIVRVDKILKPAPIDAIYHTPEIPAVKSIDGYEFERLWKKSWFNCELDAARKFDEMLPSVNVEELATDVVQILKDNGIRIDSVNISVSRTGRINFEVFGNEMDVIIERSFYREDGKLCVNHNLFNLPEKYQHKGISKAIFKAFTKQYNAAGVDELRVHANLDVGGYCWGSYGFYSPKHSAFEALNYVDESRRNRYEKVFNEFYAKHSDTEPFPMYNWMRLKDAAEDFKGSDWIGVLQLKNPSHRIRFLDYLFGKK